MNKSRLNSDQLKALGQTQSGKDGDRQSVISYKSNLSSRSRGIRGVGGRLNKTIDVKD
jgi:hypothetical protein